MRAELLILLLLIFVASCNCAGFSTDNAKVTELSVDEHGETRPVENEENGELTGQNKCTLYYAPSSIKKSAAYGVYTTRNIGAGMIISEKDGPSIAVTDPHLFMSTPPHIHLLNKFWIGRHNGMTDHMRYEATTVAEYQFMLGVLPRVHRFLGNLDFEDPSVVYDDSLANGRKGPGAGAFSYYSAKRFFATQTIEAGQELFFGVGDYWLESSDSDTTNYVKPETLDYSTAGTLLSQFEMALEHVRQGKATQTESEHLLWMLYMAASSADGVEHVLPKTADVLETIVRNAKSFDPTDLAYSVAEHLSVERRNVSWIEDNGLCLDAVKSGMSTIAGAGNGAFAARTIDEGETIVPVPLLHIMDRAAFATYPSTTVVREGVEQLVQNLTEEPTGEQQLLNYCFGHARSSLVLCPLSNAALINHCSQRSGSNCGDSSHQAKHPGPNAKLQWASEWDPITQKFLSAQMEELRENMEDSILMFEVVALRAIEAGEEIFIDYGAEWESAWKRHVGTWTPPPTDDSTISSALTKIDLDTSDRLNVTADLRAINPFHNVKFFPACWYEPTEHSGGSHCHDSWKELSDEEILDQFAIDGSKFEVHDGDAGEYWPCSILKVNEDILSYTVRVYQSVFHEPAAWEREGTPCLLTNYPRKSIRFLTASYWSDQHLASAFRHPIGIPDDIFPAQWKDL